MTGRVVSSHFPYMPIRITVRGRTVAIEAFLDTGFEGDLVIPPGLITDIGTPNNYLSWFLADGSRVRAPAYLGTVEIGSLGVFEGAVTILGNEPIVGRRLTDRFRVILDHGREVIVEP